MAILEVRVTPRASRERIEWAESGCRVYVTAAPTDGQANQAVQNLISKRLGIARSKVVLKRGETSRIKQFQIDELTDEEIRNRLLDA